MTGQHAAPTTTGGHTITAREVRRATDRGEGCLGKAADDEPVFVLRAKDRAFQGCLDRWLEINRESSAEKRAGVEAIQRAGRDWQAKNGTKVPD